MISGLHGPNTPLPTDPTDPLWALLKTANPGSVKLLDIDGCHHTVADALSLARKGVPTTVLRLRDWRPGPFFIPPDKMALILAPTINTWFHAGTRIFQLFNEPNWLWARLPWGPWQFQYYLRVLWQELQPLVPAGCQFIGPPLSWGPALWHLGGKNTTNFVLNDWIDAFEFTGSGPAIIELFNYNGFNTYFQYPDQLEDPSYGRNYTKWARPWVTEWASSPVPGEDPEPRRLVEYPAWIEKAEAEGVAGSQLFIWGGTSQWKDFQLTGPVAHVLT